MDHPFNFKHQILLIIDDELTTLTVMEEYLGKAGFKIIKVQSGEEGIALAHSYQPDLILLDIVMPRIDGFETCRRLKANKATHEIPVIFMTVLNSIRDKIKGFEVGGIDYITKPIQQAEVLARLNTHLSLRAMQKYLEKQNTRLKQEIVRCERTEEALRDSEERFKAIFNNAGVGINLSNHSNGHFIQVNTKFAKMLNYSPEELMNKSIFDVIHPRHIAQCHKKRRQLATKEINSFQIEQQYIRKGGSTFWGHLWVTSLHDVNDKVNATISILVDLTARKRAEEKIRQLSRAVEQSYNNIVITDKKGQIEFVNPAFTRTTGYLATEVIGKNPRVISSHKHTPSFYKTLWNTLNRGEVWQGEFLNKRKDGELYWEQATISPLKDEAGKITHYLAVKEEITQRKQAEKELLQAKQSAEAANQAKNEFIAKMSHELRTPLNAILGFAQIMQQSQTLPPEHLENVKIINRNGEYLLSLINDILDMSKIEAGKLTLSEQDFDLHHLLDEVYELFYLKARNKSLQLQVKWSDKLPRYVHTDSGKLRQVLINLISNAIKFTHTGKIDLSVEVAPESSTIPKDGLYFTIQDTGAGIAEDELGYLFKAFSQTTTGRAIQEGTGLGLAISRKFVQLMGGKISVKSQIGKGTQFEFSIRAPVMNPDNIITHCSPIRQVVALEPNQLPYRILIVDDIEDNRQLLVKLLEPLGFKLREACHGKEAIDIWKTWQPHLIWMDIRMPIMDGLQATQYIKTLSKKEKTVIIAIATSMIEEERAMALSVGCDGFLSKPFRAADIFELMHQHIGVRYI